MKHFQKSLHRSLSPITSLGAMRVLIPCALALLLLGACSTTRRLGPDQTLYTGVKSININPPEGTEELYFHR